MRMTGGCLCGGLRYVIEGAPSFAGYCCCADCRKASGSGFVGFMGVDAGRVRFSGEARAFASPAAGGRVAVRNFCPVCGGLVYGGTIGVDGFHTVYAGSLDDAAGFRPTMAIFLRDKPEWVVLPEGLVLFDTMPA